MKTDELITIDMFKSVAKDLANKWSSVLDYDEVLAEAYYLYSMKPNVFLEAYNNKPESFRQYVYQSVENFLIKQKLSKQTKWHRHNYLCNDDMMDLVVSGSKRLNAIYQPTNEQLCMDIINMLTNSAPTELQEAWMKITKAQRQRLTEYSQRGGTMTDSEYQSAKRFIMRVF